MKFNHKIMKHSTLKFFAAFALFSVPCASLAADFSEGGISYNILEGSNVEVTKSEPAYTGEVVIPASVTHDGATYTVTAIGNEAFYFCMSVTKVTLPEGITVLGPSAFDFCMSLAEVNIPSTVTSIGDDAFRMCGKIAELNLPEGLKSIGKEAFQGCTSLTSIVIPDAVESIGEYAFQRNTAAMTLKIGSGIKTIEDYAFSSCSAVAAIEVPEGVTSIGKFAFSDCSALESLKLPQSLKTIDNNAFARATSLSDVSLPDALESVGCRIFLNSKWENEQPDGLIIVDDYVAYWQKGKLPENSAVTLPDGVRILAGDAFNQQIKLAAITLPESLVAIGEKALWYCNSLTELTIPDNVKTIGSEAMGYCASIKTLSLGKSLTDIGAKAFQYALPTVVKSYNPVPPTMAGTDVFDIDVYSAAALQVPQGSLDAYKEAAVWENFENIEDALPGGQTGVWSAVTDLSGIAVDGNGVVSTTTGAAVSVHDVAGRLVGVGTEVKLGARGIYIVKAGNQVLKLKY